MKLILFIAVAVLFPAISGAQTRVNYNTQDGAIFPKGFLYPTFQDGQTFSKNGTRGTAKMNYNRFTNEMLFLNRRNDTLKLKKPETVVAVTIASDTFYHFDKVFYKKMTHHHGVPNLYQSQQLEYVTTERSVVYGYSSTSVSEIMPIANNMGNQAKIGEDKRVVFRISSDMIVMDDEGVFKKVSPTVFFDMLPQFKSEMEAFIKKEKINFKKPEDVTAFVAYMHTLQ